MHSLDLITRRLLYLFFFLLSAVVTGQDVEAALNRIDQLKAEKLQITGGLNFTNQAYFSSGIDARRDGNQWNARANLNFSFAGVNAPFSFTLSDANQQFNLPSYSFIGVSPRYKWATLHAGDRSMNFSKYTFGGISFRGVGLELQPGKWYLGAFYGQLNRALASDLNAVQSLNGIYERRGYGLKVGYGDQKFSYEFILFGANDDENPSLELPSTLSLTPANNRVVSFKGRQAIGKKLTAQVEVAQSAFNLDRNAPELADGEQNIGNQLLGLINPTESMLTGGAGNATLFYNGKGFGLQTGYERITRGFRTLGALFFNNDSENITAGFNTTQLKGKLGIFVNGGLERTNLDEVDTEVTSRVIGAVNLSYRPDDKWMTNLGFSNFRNDTKLRAQQDPAVFVDSIFLAQVTRSGNLMVTRRLGGEASARSVTLSMSHQRANNIIDDEVDQQSNTRFTNLQLNYAGSLEEYGLQYNLGLNANFTELASFGTRSFAPAAGLTKRFFNNALSMNLRTALSFVSQDNADNDNVFNANLGGTWRLANSHSLNFGVTHLNRFGSELANRNFSEWYLQAGYGFRFGGNIGLAPTRLAPAAAPENAARPLKKKKK
jgi:hypothetical protein